uniref:NADH:ubiquinone oxidoreductase subunit S6 n=1 Tax=Suricata suricatta TaxID=37032 RepID=A0A673SWE1_SURSU
HGGRRGGPVLRASPAAAPGWSVGTGLPGGPSFSFQVYDDKDYRRIRFVGRQKEVNENFAIDLIAEQPVSGADSRVVACDGGGGALGHPKVYINLIFPLGSFQDKETNTGTCGYCGLQFRQQRQH